MGRASGSNLRDNVEWVRRYFRDNPLATVDEGARAAHNARRALNRGLISDIRREVEAERVQGIIKPVPMPTPPIVRKHPRVYFEEPKMQIAKTPTKAEAVVQKPQRDWVAEHSKLKPRSEEAIQLRREWVNDLLLENPGLHPQEIIGKGKSLFGLMTSWEYVYDVCRASREMHGLEQIPTYPRHNEEEEVEVPAPVPVKIDETDSEDRLVSWPFPTKAEDRLPHNYNKTHGYKVMTKREVPAFLEQLLDSGVNPAEIRVWKQAALKVRIDVE